MCLVPYLRCLVRRYDRGRLDVVQSTGGKEQHSAAVQLGKGVRDTIQVFQGPLPVLKHIYIYVVKVNPFDFFSFLRMPCKLHSPPTLDGGERHNVHPDLLRENGM